MPPILTLEQKKLAKKHPQQAIQVNRPKPALAYNDSRKKKSRPFPKLTFFLPLFASLLLFCDFHLVLCRIFFPWLVSALSFDHIFCPSPPNPKGFCSKRPILPFLTSARMGVFKGWTQMNWWCSCILRKSVLPSQTLKNVVSMLIRRLFDEVLF